MSINCSSSKKTSLVKKKYNQLNVCQLAILRIREQSVMARRKIVNYRFVFNFYFKVQYNFIALNRFTSDPKTLYHSFCQFQ